MVRHGPLAGAQRLGQGHAFQPIVDLHDGAVVGYEACGERDAALRHAAEHGLGAPFTLLVRADGRTLEQGPPERPHTGLTLLVELTERALVERPEAVLRALTALRSAGWGIALDAIGGDARSLALMSILYPDVIRLDLRLLAGRTPGEVARVVTAVAAEAERRRATVLAIGVDDEERLAAARAFGATLGQGALLGPPAELPAQLPRPGRPLRLPGGAGDPFGPTPWERVTNWRRPAHGARAVAVHAVDVLVAQADALGESAVALASLSDERFGPAVRERYGRLAERLAFVGVLNAGDTFAGTAVRGGALAPHDPLRGTATFVTLGSDFAACLVMRPAGAEQWEFAVTYDRDTVLQCALPLMARMAPLDG